LSQCSKSPQCRQHVFFKSFSEFQVAKARRDKLKAQCPSCIKPRSSTFAFPGNNSHSQADVDSSPTTWVGLEPRNDRDERWAFLASLKKEIKQRFGFLVDTGAPESAVGKEFLSRFLAAYELDQWSEWNEFVSQLHGIGAGSAEVNYKCSFPVGLSSKLDNCFLEAQVLEGCGAKVPGLLGLTSLFKHRAVLDLSDETNPFMTVSTHKGRLKLPLQHVHGHLVLPIDQFQNTAHPVVKNQSRLFERTFRFMVYG